LLVGGVFNNNNNKNHTQIDLGDNQSGHYDGATKGTGVFGDRASWFRSSMVVVSALSSALFVF